MQRTLDQEDGGLRFTQQAFFVHFVTISTVIDLIRDRLIPFCLFGRGKHVKPYRDKTVSIRPAESEHSKPFLVSMGGMVIDPCQKFHSFAPVPGKDRIIKDQDFDLVGVGQGTEDSRYFSSKEQKEFLPVERNVIQETIVGILRNSLIFVPGIQKAEKIFLPKYQQQQKPKYLIGRNPTQFGNIGFPEKFSKLKFFHCIRKLILGMFILTHWVYHKTSTSSFVFI